MPVITSPVQRFLSPSPPPLPLASFFLTHSMPTNAHLASWHAMRCVLLFVLTFRPVDFAGLQPRRRANHLQWRTANTNAATTDANAAADDDDHGSVLSLGEQLASAQCVAAAERANARRVAQSLATERKRRLKTEATLRHHLAAKQVTLSHPVFSLTASFFSSSHIHIHTHTHSLSLLPTSLPCPGCPARSECTP